MFLSDVENKSSAELHGSVSNNGHNCALNSSEKPAEHSSRKAAHNATRERPVCQIGGLAEAVAAGEGGGIRACENKGDNCASVS